MAALINLIKDGTISGRQAKEVFEVMVESGDAPDKIVEERGMKQVSDEGALAAIIDELVSNNPKQVEASTRKSQAGWLVRWTSHEGDRWTSESRGGEQTAEG